MCSSWEWTTNNNPLDHCRLVFGWPGLAGPSNCSGLVPDGQCSWSSDDVWANRVLKSVPNCLAGNSTIILSTVQSFSICKVLLTIDFIMQVMLLMTCKYFWLLDYVNKFTQILSNRFYVERFRRKQRDSTASVSKFIMCKTLCGCFSRTPCKYYLWRT